MTRDTFDMFHQREDRGRFGDKEGAPRRRVTGSSDLVDLAVVLHVDTADSGKNGGAVLVSNNGDEARAEWIPHSRCQIVHTGRMAAGRRRNGQAVQLEAVTITLSEALAKEKGLL